MINGRTRLHVVANGTMTGQRYIDEVLLPHVCLFHGAVGDKFVFMDDNATCHRTLAVQDCVDSEGIQRLLWPGRSPDLNPIENVWDALGRQVAGRNYPPTNKNSLIRELTEEWDKLPQQLLDNVVQGKASQTYRGLDAQQIFDAPIFSIGVVRQFGKSMSFSLLGYVFKFGPTEPSLEVQSQLKDQLQRPSMSLRVSVIATGVDKDAGERDEAHFWLNGYVNKQNCRIWSEATPQVYVETPLHLEKLTVWCALWAGGILLQKR
ncbi:DDE_3 domain-containing protein [Trichonephila clavipes]|nr:DDE_3 domain-containing protein [Trichonephila clavipes]